MQKLVEQFPKHWGTASRLKDLVAKVDKDYGWDAIKLIELCKKMTHDQTLAPVLRDLYNSRNIEVYFPGVSRLVTILAFKANRSDDDLYDQLRS